MITAMVKVAASNENLNRRLTALTWVMLALTWVTFIIAVPNTLATVFGIPKINESLPIEVMTYALIGSTLIVLLLAFYPNSALSIRDMKKRLQSEE